MGSRSTPICLWRLARHHLLVHRCDLNDSNSISDIPSVTNFLYVYNIGPTTAWQTLLPAHLDMLWTVGCVLERHLQSYCQAVKPLSYLQCIQQHRCHAQADSARQ